jgi:hypothetical protein
MAGPDCQYVGETGARGEVRVGRARAGGMDEMLLEASRRRDFHLCAVLCSAGLVVGPQHHRADQATGDSSCSRV